MYFIVTPYVLVYVQFTHKQIQFLILKNALKFTLKYTKISLLHVSVFDHHQGACTEPG